MSDKYVKSTDINNGLDGYSTDENNVILIDPNVVPVKHEDLFIYATLRARARTKSLISVDDSDSKYITEISFLPGTETSVGEVDKSSFLTTNWTNIGGKNFTTNVDYETFGMTSIDISLNAGFIPTVVIEFTDVRGATLFEQGSCSPYAAFFHQPYPIFELTVKGFYGSPVTYYLAIQKFNTSFDPQSGNYKSRGEFIGYSYAFLSDILLGYILAAPYMENSCGKLEEVYTKYLEYYNNRGLNSENSNPFYPFDDQGEGLTLFEYVTRLKSLVNLEDDFSKNIVRSIQNLDSSQTLNEIPSLKKLLIENVSDYRETIIGEIRSKYPNGYQSKTDTTWNSDKINEQNDKIIIYSPKDNSLFGVINTYVEFINRSMDLYNKNFADKPDFRIDSKIKIVDSNNEYYIDFSEYDSKKDELLNKLNELEREQRRQLSQQSNNILNQQLGFVPTIRSFFTTILANTEVFLLRMLETSQEAEQYHKTNNSKFSSEDVDIVSDRYFAWPEYRERNISNQGFVQKYPGSNAANRSWPEVKFVEEFYEALLLLRKKLEEQSEEETFDFSQYENVPGRDNYFAINAMETTAGSLDPMTNYYNVTSMSSDDSSTKTNSLLESIHDRFLITSNFSILNEPILEQSSIVYKMLNSDTSEYRGKYKTTILPSFRGNLVYYTPTFNQNELSVLGSIETWNLVSSLADNLFLLGFTTANSSNLKSSIEGSSFFRNKTRDLLLSPKSQDNFGGKKTLKPNIHDMNGEDLFKINKIQKESNLLDINIFITSPPPPPLTKKITSSTTSKFLHSGYKFGIKNREKFNTLTNLSNLYFFPNYDDEGEPQLKKPEDSYLLKQYKVDFSNNNDKPLVQNTIRNFNHGGITTISFGNDLGNNRGIFSKTSNFSQQHPLNIPLRPILDIYPDYYFPYRLSQFVNIYGGKTKDDQGDHAFRYHEYGSVELTQSKYIPKVHRFATAFSGFLTFTPNVSHPGNPKTWSYDNQYGIDGKFDITDKKFDVDPQIYSPPALHPDNYDDLYTKEQVLDFLINKKPPRKIENTPITNIPTPFFYEYGLKIKSNAPTTFEVPRGNRIKISKLNVLNSLPQMNTVNNGNLITESPFWRHNFPSILSESNQYPNNNRPHYFTYYEAQWALVKNPETKPENKFDLEFKTNTLNQTANYSLLEGFPMGLRVSLDWWTDTSVMMKHFYTNSPSSLSAKRRILTNHNKQLTNGHNTSNGDLAKAHNFEIKKIGGKDRWVLVGSNSQDSGPTNYNKTKIWKGSLAYLWLANHFHRPWTGMWGTSPSWHGPIETLAQSSIVVGIPKTSLLLLGAVLWRMRENGLFISDEPRWDLPPKQNNVTYTEDGEVKYLDPLNFPIVAKEISGFNTKYFGWKDDSKNTQLKEDLKDKDTKYRNNKGVRPPTVSLFGFDRLDFNNGNRVSSMLTCFPAADEWPVLNLGMSLAKDITEVDGIKNPFKNQYRIFQTFFWGRNMLMLRFKNQGVKWLLREEQFKKLEQNLKEEFKKLQIKLEKENYSDSATAKILEATEETINKELDEGGAADKALRILQGQTFDKVADDSINISGLDESYTKLTILQHDPIYLRGEGGFSTLETGRSQSGYLRGYLPIGPELWFLPTKVKEIIIGVFEDYVGDFNNYNGTSDFDKILEEIDPLNFPYPERYLKRENPDAFKNDIVIQTTFSESGDSELFIGEIDSINHNFTPIQDKINKYNTSRNPWLSLPIVRYDSDDSEIKSIISEWDEKTRGPECDNCVDFPQPLKKWRENYQVTFGGSTQIKSTSGQAYLNNNEQPNVETSQFVYNQINFGTNNITDLTISEILNEYTVASATPRIWWGDDGSTKEYYFDQNQWNNWINGLTNNLKDNPELIKELISDGLSVVSEEQLADEDIKLDLYRSFKSIYDKWISSSTTTNPPKLFFNPIKGTSDSGRLLIDHFSFVDRTNRDIGDKVLINIEVVSQLFTNTDNSLFGVTSDILDNSNFLFFPLPSYVDLSKSITNKGSVSDKVSDLSDMFRPVATENMFIDKLNRGPHYLCMFIGATSKELNLTRNSDDCGYFISDIDDKGNNKKFDGDSFKISNPTERPPDFKNDNGGIVAFKVAFGTPNQNHFIGVNLDQSEFKNTSEALRATELISQAGDPANSSGFITKSQSLYEVFLNRSYSCTVESMGNMMIQPLQYFELENVPMFVGTYLIRDISHKITPHNMKTTFKGDRIPQAEVPLIEDIIAQFDLSQVDVSSSSDATSTSSSGGRNSGGSTNPSSNPVDLSKIPDSSNTTAIRSYLETQGFLTEIQEVKFPNPTYPYDYALKNPTNDPGQFHNYEQRVVGEKFEGIMLHWTGGWNNGVGSTINTLITRANPDKDGDIYRLCYHIIVDGDGVPHQIADLQKKANHGGPLANGTTLGLSYQGGVEKGDGETYTRTLEDWQNPSLNLISGKAKENEIFNAKKQWESLVKSILYMKTVHPQLKYITSHEWVTTKADVGSGRNNKNQFPWDKLIEDLKAGGWNKNTAGADPYIKNDWGVNRTGFSTNINKDYLLQSAITNETDEEKGG